MVHVDEAGEVWGGEEEREAPSTTSAVMRRDRRRSPEIARGV